MIILMNTDFQHNIKYSLLEREYLRYLCKAVSTECHSPSSTNATTAKVPPVQIKVANTNYDQLFKHSQSEAEYIRILSQSSSVRPLPISNAGDNNSVPEHKKKKKKTGKSKKQAAQIISPISNVASKLTSAKIKDTNIDINQEIFFDESIPKLMKSLHTEQEYIRYLCSVNIKSSKELTPTKPQKSVVAKESNIISSPDLLKENGTTAIQNKTMERYAAEGVSRMFKNYFDEKAYVRYLTAQYKPIKLLQSFDLSKLRQEIGEAKDMIRSYVKESYKEMDSFNSNLSLPTEYTIKHKLNMDTTVSRIEAILKNVEETLT